MFHKDKEPHIKKIEKALLGIADINLYRLETATLEKSGNELEAIKKGLADKQAPKS